MQGGNATLGALVDFVSATTYQAAVSPSVSQGKPVPSVPIPRPAFYYPLPFDYFKALSLDLLAYFIPFCASNFWTLLCILSAYACNIFQIYILHSS